MHDLNFHHLRYFWTVAKDGNLSRAARRLHVSQSALSTQIRQLERHLGSPLFVRAARSMQLTETGNVVLSYAETIFSAGQELLAVVQQGASPTRSLVRIGASATLSRNFQENFLRPLLQSDEVQLVLQSGALHDLLARLRVHSLDVILSNRRVVSSADDPWRCRAIARQPISLVGRRSARRRPFRFPDDLTSQPLVLPGKDNDLRNSFDELCARLGVRYRLRAEVDDMALLRLLARDTDSIALVPPVVVQDELQGGRLVELCKVPDLHETFFAITVKRHFQSPLLQSLLSRPESEMLHSER